MRRVPLVSTAGFLAAALLVVLALRAQTRASLPRLSVRRAPAPLHERAWQHGDTIPGQYIVQYHAPADTGLFARSHDDLVGALQSRGVHASVADRFDNPDFHAAIVHIPTEQDDPAHTHYMRSLEHVKNAEPVRVIVADAFRPDSVRRGSAAESPEADLAVPTGFEPDRLASANASQPLQSLHKRDPRQFGLYPTSLDEMHSLTSVTEAHSKGIRGDGVVTVVLANGVNIAIGPGIGQQSKIKFGADYVGDALTDQVDVRYDPESIGGACNNELGTAMAQTIVHDVVGVAPLAHLGVLRIFDCSGTTSSAIVVRALSAAVQMGAKVVLSQFNTDDVGEIVVAQLASMGPKATVVTGVRETQSPGSLFSSYNARQKTPFLVSVTDAETSHFDVVESAWKRVRSHIKNNPGEPLYLIKTNRRDPAFNNALRRWGTLSFVGIQHEEDDLCNLRIQIPIIVQQGYHVGATLVLPDVDCVHTPEFDNWLAQNTITRVIYVTNRPSPNLVLPNRLTFGAYVYITPDTLQTWKESVVDFEYGVLLDPADPNVNIVRTRLRISDSASRGPVLADLTASKDVTGGGSLTMSPTIAAPSQILRWAADVPYKELSGSMLSAAYVAGCAALLHSGRAVEEPRVFRELITNATPLPSAANGLLESVAVQGAGLVSVRSAFATPNIMAPAPIAQALDLGDMSVHKDSFNLRLCPSVVGEENFPDRVPVGDQRSHYIKVDKSATLYALDEAMGKPVGDLETIDSPDIVVDRVAAQGETNCLNAVVRVTYNVARVPDPRRIPVFSGYLTIVNRYTTEKVFQVPYFGIASSMATIDPVVKAEATYYATATNDEPNPSPPLMFILDGKAESDNPNRHTEMPYLSISLAYPPRHMYIDVVYKETNEAVARLVETSAPNPERKLVMWDGLTSRKTWALPGEYMFVVEALRGTKDDDGPQNYQRVESESFIVLYDLETVETWTNN